jgi:hypothetical protein
MMQALNLPTYLFNTKSESGRTYILDTIRKKYVLLTPEEWVRQHIIKYLSEEKKVPLSLMAVETGFTYNKLQRRTDVLVYDRSGNAIAIVECKAPAVKLTTLVFDQILRYNLNFKVPYLIITNGMQHYCCKLDFETSGYVFLKEIPSYELLLGID